MELHVAEYGEKGSPTVLLLHGGGVSGWMWEKQVEFLTEFHCLVPDLPGQGKSNPWGSFSIKESAQLVAQLIQKKAQGVKPML